MTTRRILIVEDDPVSVFSMKELLISRGYEVCGIIESGEKAIECVKDSRPDLILMDIMLSGKMDGIEAAKEILKKYDIPIIFLTAYSDLRTIQKMSDINSYGFIIKPYLDINVYANIEIAINKAESEHKVKTSESKYRSLFDNMVDAVYIHDFEGNFLDANQKALDLLGYSKQDISNMNFVSFLGDNQLPLALNNLEELRKDGKQKEFSEFRLKKKDGTFVWVEAMASVIYKNKMPLVIQGIAREITDRKESIAKFEENEVKFRELFENMSSGVAVYQAIDDGKDFVFVNFNKASEKINNIKRKEVIGRKVTEVFPGVTKFGLFQVFQRVWKTGKSENFPITEYKDERITGWRENYIYKLPSGEVVAIYDDLTEQKKVEFEKEKAYLELNQVCNSSASGMAIIDKKFNFLKLNNSFLKMFRVKEKELIGRNCLDFFDKEMCNKAMNQVLSDNDIFVFESEHWVNKNNKISYIATVVPYIDTNDVFVGVIINFTDVTERRLMERLIMNVVENERRRIGQDIHDGLGQEITGISYLVETLKVKLNKMNIDEISEIEEIIKLVRNAGNRTRELAHGLCPIYMTQGGFFSAIKYMVENVERMFNISCKVIKRGVVSIKNNEVATHLYYIVKESINNSVKHGNPQNIIIKLVSKDNKFTMKIVDDGKGHKSNNKNSKEGIGLQIMEFRAGIIGAKFQNFTDDKGFTVSIEMEE